MKLASAALVLMMATSCDFGAAMVITTDFEEATDAGRRLSDGGLRADAGAAVAVLDAGRRPQVDAGEPGCFRDADCRPNFHCKGNGEFAGECIADPGTCTHTTCGTSCGTVADVCGGTIACGACACVKGICGRSCGEISDGCGGTLDCGTCHACAPLSCGASCGTIPNGCGRHLDCGACPTCSATIGNYRSHTSNEEFIDPPTAVGAPGPISGLSALGATVPAGATTVSLSGSVPNAQTCCWQVEGAAGGLTTGSVAPGADGALSATLPIFCGKNTVRLVCGNGAGSRVLIRELDAPCQPKDLRVTLGWDDQGTDMELHLVRDHGHVNTELDCTWYTCVNRNIGWSATPASNPIKDVDDVTYDGPENIYLDTAEPGTYHVLVEYWGSGAPSKNTITVAVKEKTVGSISRTLQVHEVWYVGTVTFPSGAIAAVDTVTDCAASWRKTTHGCDLTLP